MGSRLLRNAFLSILGGVVGYAVCTGTGYLIVWMLGPAPDGYIGIGFDRWKLPGTLLGAITIFILAFWLPAKMDQRGRSTHL